jgi:hypothetical protein
MALGLQRKPTDGLIGLGATWGASPTLEGSPWGSNRLSSKASQAFPWAVVREAMVLERPMPQGFLASSPAPGCSTGTRVPSMRVLLGLTAGREMRAYLTLIKGGMRHSQQCRRADIAASKY